MNTSAQLLKIFLMLAAVLALGAVQAQTSPSSNKAAGGAVKLESLRAGVPLSDEIPVLSARPERDRGTLYGRDFVQQPPLIPHASESYEISKNFNKCMDCHSFARAQASGAPKVSVTHFRTREGQELDNISPRRYFCNQCHVSQTDAKPLVDNTFQRSRGLQ
jgi:cytochrome c-type protein NapB